MASKRQAVVKLRTMQLLHHQARLMSSAGSKTGKRGELVYHEHGDQDAKQVWPDLELCSLDPYNQSRFPLPGNIGFSLYPTEAKTDTRKPTVNPELAIHQLPNRYQNQADIINQFSTAADAMTNSEDSQKSKLAQMDVEIKIQDCPQLMRQDFQQLFPGSQVMTGDFTVLSLCQRTINDMSGWSPQVSSEREILLELYTETATEICTALRNAGYWADFIDQCSGKPFYGEHTTDTMFETDTRYRHFGFDIEDLGCCKVIKHHKWGTRAFVGCIFTTAPSTAPVLVELTQIADSS